MKKTILLIAILLAISSFASASPISCIGINLQTALAQGSNGCTLDNLLLVFSGYTYTAQNGTAPAITNGSDVNLIQQPGNPNSLSFQTADWDARGNTTNPLLSRVRTIDIVYSGQTAPSSDLITGASADAASTGPATLTATCNAGCGSLVNFSSGSLTAIGPVPGPITITDHLVLGSTSGTSTGHVSILTNAFEVAPSTAPEPGTTMLMGGGFLLLGMGLARRKRSARS
jgi:hypothetical protein